MYEYKTTKGKIKRVFIVIIFMAIASVTSIFIYNMYVNTDNNSLEESKKKSKIVRLSQNIKNEEKTQQDIIELLEQTTKCVVGISKIKNSGNSILLNNSTEELGLGTGMIITENRIYSY